MEKRKRLYWTPCAAHCIDLMLEDFEKKLPIHKETIARGKKITTYIYSRTALIVLLHHFTKGGDLIRPATTRFATSYLTLGCLNDNKQALFRMFTSKDWTTSTFAKSKDGKLIEETVTDKGFWKNIIVCLRAAYPLIKVLRLVDSMRSTLKGVQRWTEQRLSREFREVICQYGKSLIRTTNYIGPYMSYYLSPQLHYSSGFKADWEVKKGFYDCLQRVVGDMDEISKIDCQLEDFKMKSKFFGSQIAMQSLMKKTPAQWWESYGSKHKELQKFAIRVLSLTCSSSGCERNWSAFEMVHTKKRNRLKQKTMNNVVFVMANSKLEKNKQRRKGNQHSVEDLDSDDDWLVDQSEDVELDDVDATHASEELPLPPSSSEIGASGEDEVGLASLDDLEISNFEELALEDDGRDIGLEDEHENEDEMEGEDDYCDQNLNDLLGL